MPSDIVEQTAEFFFSDPKVEHVFKAFAVRHCRSIDYKNEEMKLEYTDLHKKFVQLYEKMLTDFVESKGQTIEGLYKALREGCLEDSDGHAAMMAQILLATADFDVFMQLMFETAKSEGFIRERQHKEAVDARREAKRSDTKECKA